MELFSSLGYFSSDLFRLSTLVTLHKSLFQFDYGKLMHFNIDLTFFFLFFFKFDYYLK